MLAGYKTYIVGAIMILAGLGEIFLDIPGMEADGMTLLMEGLAFVGLRLGIAKT